MRKTGKLDKNGKEIREGDLIRLHDPERFMYNGIYKVKWGEGTYDSGVYTYIGFYCEDQGNGDSDGFGWVITEESKLLEIIESSK